MPSLPHAEALPDFFRRRTPRCSGVRDPGLTYKEGLSIGSLQKDPNAEPMADAPNERLSSALATDSLRTQVQQWHTQSEQLRAAFRYRAR